MNHLNPYSQALLQRVRQIKRLNHLTVETLAAEAGMSRATVQNQLSGKYDLDVRVLLALAKLAPDISAEYLLRGYGDIIQKNDITADVLLRLERLEQIIHK